MSLDNVVAVAAAARGDLLLVTFGISLSIPVVVWGSGILARLMTRAPWIVWLGGGVLGYVAGEMALRDRIVQGWLGARVASALERPVPLVLGVALTALGWWFDRAARRTDSD
jgi:predicted tellurium resistance membrane protein TerC